MVHNNELGKEDARQFRVELEGLKKPIAATVFMSMLGCHACRHNLKVSIYPNK